MMMSPMSSYSDIMELVDLCPLPVALPCSLTFISAVRLVRLSTSSSFRTAPHRFPILLARFCALSPRKIDFGHGINEMC